VNKSGSPDAKCRNYSALIEETPTDTTLGPMLSTRCS